MTYTKFNTSDDKKQILRSLKETFLNTKSHRRWSIPKKKPIWSAKPKQENLLEAHSHLITGLS